MGSRALGLEMGVQPQEVSPGENTLRTEIIAYMWTGTCQAQDRAVRAGPAQPCGPWSPSKLEVTSARDQQDEGVMPAQCRWSPIPPQLQTVTGCRAERIGFRGQIG